MYLFSYILGNLDFYGTVKFTYCFDKGQIVSLPQSLFVCTFATKNAE